MKYAKGVFRISEIIQAAVVAVGVDLIVVREHMPSSLGPNIRTSK